MPIHLRENQYRGVNAHLHSFLQSEPGGWWETFHSSHVAHIRDSLDVILPAGYYALNEKSLQIDRYEVEGPSSKHRLDVIVYSTPMRIQATSSATAASPTATIPVTETLSDEDFLTSVVIYRGESIENIKPVTRIELLSPSNKPPISNYQKYLAKRDEPLLSGINIVEIDYLHQTRSPIKKLPSYPDLEQGATPYAILVSTPHPTLAEGTTSIYAFRVDDSIPTVVIPLAGEDAIEADLGAVYNRTFFDNKFYGEIAVDYEQKPLKFTTYEEEDQRRIEARMVVVAEAQRRNLN